MKRAALDEESSRAPGGSAGDVLEHERAHRSAF
jgi:hypothetical protein